MTSAEGIEPKRSGEYSKLLEELKQAFVSAADVAVKLYEQGKKDGLSNEAIRKDIETTFDGIVKERRLSEILPTKSKQSYTHALTFDSALRKADVGSNKLQRKNKSNKELTPQQSVALIGSIIIIVMAFGGLGLVYFDNVFGSTEFLTYENPDYNIRMEYPANWTKSEMNLNPYEVAFYRLHVK
jgi:hypothetical protein